jgi:hypothetical protein
VPARNVDDAEESDEKESGGSTREVVAAWVVVLVLLAIAVFSFALDNMVTVSDNPAEAIGAPSPDADEDGDDGPPARELRDKP